MEKKDLENLKQAIRRADVFTLITLVLIIILLVLNITTLNHLMGLILGYIGVKFIYQRQYKIYSEEEVSIGANIFINIAIYALIMFLAVLISFESFIILAFVIIIYRNIVLYSFKSLHSQ